MSRLATLLLSIADGQVTEDEVREIVAAGTNWLAVVQAEPEA